MYPGANMNYINEELLSVIVPCYNSEDCISDAIESILNCTYANVEVIVVNDGSNGDFAYIYEKYRRCGKVKFVQHKKNRGLLAARMSGIMAAHGKYIAFCDADDSVSFDFYRKLVCALEENHADIAVGDTALKYSEENIKYLNLDPFLINDFCLNGEEVIDAFMQQEGMFYTYHVVWNKVYSRELILMIVDKLEIFVNNNVNITMCEDIAFSSLVWLNAKKVVNEHNIFYYYTRNASQETQKKYDDEDYLLRLNSVGSVFRFFKENLLKYCKWEKYKNHYSAWLSLYCRIWFSTYEYYNLSIDIESAIRKNFPGCKLESSNKEDNFFLSIQTDLGKNLQWHDEIKRKICSNKTSYVSFDVFDTLITRPLLYPDDVFCLMNIKVNEILNSSALIDFRKIRMEAEKCCRNNMNLTNNIEDINLDNIYDYIIHIYGIPREYAEQIKKLELETEMSLLKPRKIGKELYDFAVYFGKKIICISDMYLPEEFIARVLQKNNYVKYDKIFVSSEYMALKTNGNLYKIAADVLGIKDLGGIVHIGDNWQADVEEANKLGMKTGHLPNASTRFRGYSVNYYAGNILKNITDESQYLFNDRHGVGAFIGIRAMLGIIADKFLGESILPYNIDSDINANPYMLGYYLLGMHVYAVASWLISKASKGKTIHFVARDGYLLKKAVEILSPETRTNYIYLSRKATAALLIEKEHDLLALMSFIRPIAIKPETIYSLFIYVLKDNHEYLFKKFCHEKKYLAGRKFTSDSQCITFMHDFFRDIVDHDKLKYLQHSAKIYFSEIIKNGDVLFDIGYSARNEHLFSKMLDIPLTSYYIHINEDKCKARMRLSHVNIETFYDTTPSMYTPLRETLLSQYGPSCIGYSIDNGIFSVEFEKFTRSVSNEYIISMIHKGVIDFINDFKTIFAKYESLMFYRAFDASMPYEYFLHFAKKVDREIFSTFLFEDDIYGGQTLNLASDWQYLQDSYLKGTTSQEKDLNQKCDEFQREICDLKQQLNEKYNTLKNEQNLKDKLINKCDRLQDELDMRWLLLNAVHANSEIFGKMSMDEILRQDAAGLAADYIVPAPPDFDEDLYLSRYKDVANAVKSGQTPSAFMHYMLHGRNEYRKR